MSNNIFPPYLKNNDTIGICAPSGFITYEHIEPAIKLFKQNNWSSIIGDTFNSDSHNYFSAPDELRLKDLQIMLDNSQIKCIVFARGGYGLSRIIDKINWSGFLKNPKWICGYSDITLLLNHINSQLKICCLHSPMAKGLQPQDTEQHYINHFINTLKGLKEKIYFNEHTSLLETSIKAELVGGNLTLLAHGIGSLSEINTHNKILFIEDIDEYMYAIDRMFLQLKRAEKLKTIKALIVGGFTNIKQTKRPWNINLNDIINQHCQEYGFPIIYNFPIGHQMQNASVKIGATYSLTLQKEKSFLQEQ